MSEVSVVTVEGYSGNMVMLGYYNDEKATQEALGPDRWYHTGYAGLLQFIPATSDS